MNDGLLSALEKAISRVNSIAGLISDTSYTADSARLAELKERLLSGRFHLAVLGQFKRGKSTLLNAMLGQSILPTAVVPLTAIPTWIRAGESLRARVEFADSKKPEEFATPDVAKLSDFLARFVTESANPKNRLGVRKVEVYSPSPILNRGVVFIDTPGIGSTFRHNTATTLHFLSECDAAMFLVSADPPITETEVEFLGRVKTRVSRLFFILNKVDYLKPPEVNEAIRFFRKVIGEQAGFPEDTPIFAVSAREALNAKATGDDDRWRAAGLANVERHLVDFLAKEKTASLGAAVRQKALDAVEDVVMRLRLLLRSLELPLEDLLSRMETFDRRIEDLQRERQDAHDLLAGDRRRVHELLEHQYEQLCQRVRIGLNEALDKEMAAIDSKPANESVLQETLNAAVPTLFDTEFKDEIQHFEGRLSEVLRPHQDRLNRLVESIRKTAAGLFDVPYRPIDNSVAVGEAREPYWVTYHYEESFGPISPSMIDKFVPPRLRHRRIERRFRDKIDSLVLFNAGKLREKLYDQIELTFSRFGRAMDERLAATVTATHGAAQTAVKKRQIHAGIVASDIDRLRKSVSDLEEITAELRGVNFIDSLPHALISFRTP